MVNDFQDLQLIVLLVYAHTEIQARVSVNLTSHKKLELNVYFLLQEEKINRFYLIEVQIVRRDLRINLDCVYLL